MTDIDLEMLNKAAQLKPVDLTTPAPLSRTDASIQPNVVLSIVDIDQQSAQFTCELTISNVADDDFDVCEIRPRLPRGITLDEAVDTAQAAKVTRYNDLCKATGSILTSAILLDNQEIAVRQAHEMQAVVRQSLNVRGVLNVYWSILLGKTSDMQRLAKERAFAVAIESAHDVGEVLKQFSFSDRAKADVQIAQYNRTLLAAIEGDADFSRDAQAVTLKRGQQYKIVYILRGERGYINAKAYSISFEIPFTRGSYATSRMEYVRISVPPGSTWPTLFAMGSAVIGSYIQSYPNVPELNLPHFDPTDTIKSLAMFIVPILTALVVYNIYDMTSLKDAFKSQRGWRSAILIGFLCGFLNHKILAALTALLQ